MSSLEKIFRQPQTTLSSCCVYFGENKELAASGHNNDSKPRKAWTENLCA